MHAENVFLVYALMQFAIHFATSVMYGYIGYGSIIGDTSVVSRGQSLIAYSKLLCFSGSVCLFATRLVNEKNTKSTRVFSKLLRRTYKETRWPATCVLFKRTNASVSSVTGT